MTLTPQNILLRRQIRNKIRQQRCCLGSQQRQIAAKLVAERVINHDRVQQAKSIAVFLSFDGELNTQPIIEQLWQQQKQLYLPVLHPFSRGNLLFLHYDATTQLIINQFKIREPQLDVRAVLPLAQLDIILTPLVAFDRFGQRLGMGGGFYDRTLQYWQQQGTYPIGLAYDCQLVDKLPVADWDIPLPEIITPDEVWRWPLK
ncbi:5-formyltetrahydrofolate cyclo-ligase [Candidatus Fukatsuia symbiotica]|uniref:5-formyltetrahydrofolate cyclo-ligase n=1 Tax=Candidatus Fukatsuia TaxID=1927833 RepID=UPI000934DB67|nr:5-formyltetrahydrofolate cyclo-ligase [Candidatus Fukatsuia symbiotica]MEA9445052.1 5-formyltetrahydrofolate cyclo-ligase [Candidatus Fukatsuia symbiotica]